MTNRLNTESSLYLLQHADNPVDWHPWDDEAITLAKDQGKPILLSIGYSACHWCHVMAHESFEDKATAEVMNRLYVNIKIDREERPDLDKSFQMAHQLLTGRGGGWPLTLWLNPDDLTPFFAGTYFPPTARHGMPAFSDVLVRARSWFDQNQEEIQSQNQRLRDAFQSIQATSITDEVLTEAPLGRGSQIIESHYDSNHGGFGTAPKFPQAPLLRLSGVLQAPIFLHSLQVMAESGLRDHLDGGFFRYTVDGDWTIPHFEKMLYDNALLLPLYAQAARQQNDPLCTKAARGIVRWLCTEMKSPENAYYASLDADADGEEGLFHIWQVDEVKNLLSPEQFALFSPAYGLDRAPNFEGKAWHLKRYINNTELAKRYDLSEDEISTQLKASLDRLLKHRQQRIAPGRDDKLLTSWNALLIHGLCQAAADLEEASWVDMADDIHHFLRKQLWQEQQLYAVYADHEPRFPAYLDDYAFLLQASLSLLEQRWSEDVLIFSCQLADRLLGDFEDKDHGGFFFTAHQQDMPLGRSKPLHDDATPSGNGIAVQTLLQLGHLTGEVKYLQSAERCLKASWTDMGKSPSGHASLLMGLRDYLSPASLVVILGHHQAQLQEWKHLVQQQDRVHCYLLDSENPQLPGLPGQYRCQGEITAYVCHGARCLPPAVTKSELKERLKER